MQILFFLYFYLASYLFDFGRIKTWDLFEYEWNKSTKTKNKIK